MSPRACAPILLLLAVASSVTAQTQDNPAELRLPRSSDPGKRPFLRTFIGDEWRMWSSPFRGDSYDSKALTKYIVPFALITTALIATDTKISDQLPNTTDQTVWSGRVSQLGAAYTLAGFSAATYLIGKATKNKHTREAGWLALEAIAHTQLVVYGVKQATNRERPDRASGAGFWEGGDSFPSGHAATSFAVAAVFAYEYREHIAVPIIAYTVATGIAASRLSAQRHWMSDIFVGASTGFLIGRYIYKHHHDPSLPGSPVSPGDRTVKWIPSFGIGPKGPMASWNL